jgi:L-galactose dehydrogenase
MKDVVLGRTGLIVSVVGLGCGGHSRLGQRQGASKRDSIELVRNAIDLGVTFIDTARQYGTEDIVGEALQGRREGIVVSTKVGTRRKDNTLVDVATLSKAIDRSLKCLQTETIDIFHLHGVSVEDYTYCREELVPELVRRRESGALRFLAISERFGQDSGHAMLQLATADSCWDVVMVGFNIMNSSARDLVLPATIEKGIGVEVMYAVRNILSKPDKLRSLVVDLVTEGRIKASDIDPQNPLGFLMHAEGPHSITEAAYRFARHEPGCHVVLTGTGSLEHLKNNIRSINADPLPDADLARLAQLFNNLTHISGD